MLDGDDRQPTSSAAPPHWQRNDVVRRCISQREHARARERARARRRERVVAAVVGACGAAAAARRRAIALAPSPEAVVLAGLFALVLFVGLAIMRRA